MATYNRPSGTTIVLQDTKEMVLFAKASGWTVVSSADIEAEQKKAQRKAERALRAAQKAAESE